jgi:histone H3/H4
MESTIHNNAVNDIDDIFGAALVAIGRGAKGLRIELAAVQFLRRQFVARISEAVEAPDWRDKWRDEQAYLLAQAEALGRQAARLAKQEGRTFIAGCDVAAAIGKVRGHLPMAGRWCPY